MTDAFNLDVILGESKPKPLTYKGEKFELPGELPADCLAPFLADDLGLVDIVTAYLASDDDDDDEKKDGDDTTSEADKGFGDMVMSVLEKNPHLPTQLVAAVKESFKRLLGETPEEQQAEFERFLRQRPTVRAYMAIARGVLNEYGVSLADFFYSDEPSENAEESSKPTSPTTTPEPTSEASGDAPATPAS